MTRPDEIAALADEELLRGFSHECQTNDYAFGHSSRFRNEVLRRLSATSPGDAVRMREALQDFLVENDGDEADDECELCDGRGTVDAHTTRDADDGHGRDEIGCPACIERAHSRSARAALAALAPTAKAGVLTVQIVCGNGDGAQPDGGAGGPSNPATPTPPSADVERLDFFTHNTNCELSCSWEEEDGPWQVHRVNGGRNDREWTLIGTGATPREAIDSAIQSAAQGGGTQVPEANAVDLAATSKRSEGGASSPPTGHTGPSDPAQEPEVVAYRWRYVDEKTWTLRKDRPRHADDHDVFCEPLYTRPVSLDREAVAKELRKLYHAYVNLLEIGRDRIIALGGSCDAVDVMEAGDPALVSARTILALIEGRT